MDIFRKDNSQALCAAVKQPRLFSYDRKVLRTSLSYKKPSGQDRTAAEQWHVAKATRRIIYCSTKIFCQFFAKTFGCCRRNYNLMLSDQMKSYKDTGKFISVSHKIQRGIFIFERSRQFSLCKQTTMCPYCLVCNSLSVCEYMLVFV